MQNNYLLPGEEQQEERFERRLATLLMYYDCCAYCGEEADYECDRCHHYVCAKEIIVSLESKEMLCWKCDGSNNEALSYSYPERYRR